MRTLGLRLPANATPLSRLRVIFRRRRAVQRVFETDLASATRFVRTIRFGLWGWSWVTYHTGDEGAEGEEGKGIDDEQMCDEVARRV